MIIFTVTKKSCSRKRSFSAQNHEAAEAFCRFLKGRTPIQDVAKVELERQEPIRAPTGQPLKGFRAVYPSGGKNNFSGYEIRRRIAGLPQYVLNADVIKQLFKDCPLLHIVDSSQVILDDSLAAGPPTKG